MQVDLLRVLEEKKMIRIGDSEPMEVDFRLISATKRDIETEVREGRFREDFFYRINIITVHMPPLRKRKDDIPLLVDHFLEKYSQETAKKVDHISPSTMKLLTRYNWPGNVRELENAIERAVVLSRSRTLGDDAFAFLRPSAPFPEAGGRSLKEMEKGYIEQVLTDCDWNVTEAAKILEINRVTLHRMIKRYDLKKP
jgi:two-component system response regulator HydG